MKSIPGIFIAALLVPIVSFGQVTLSKAQLDEVIKLSKDGQTEMAIKKIESLHRSVTVHDSLYLRLVGISEEINSRACYYEAAIRDDEEIIKLAPAAEAYAQGAIGQYEFLIGDFNGAIAAYTRQLALDNKNQHVYDGLVSVYNQSGKYREAIGILNSKPAIYRGPQDQYQYAVAYFNLNMQDSARLNIDRCLRSGTSTGEFQRYILAARIYAARLDKKKGCEYISQANDIITKTKIEEQMQLKPARVKEYYFVKQCLKEIETAKELKTKLCE